MRKTLANVAMFTVLSMMVWMSVVLIFGIIDSNAEVSSSYTRTAGDKAAGHFTVANRDGEYGEVDKSKLESDLTGCKIDEPGFSETEPLLIGLEGEDCLPASYSIQSSFVTPFYDDGGYYSVKITDERGISPENYGLGPGLSAGS
jgi:hypothetical protein